MKVGFTGTQIGMSPDQKRRLYETLRKLKTSSKDENNEFHHGDCIGSDTEAHEIALMLGYDVIIHPPTNPKKRTFCEGYKRRANPLPYLDRNKRIVESTEILIVAPKSSIEELRSGTWSTYRYAKTHGRMIIILNREDS